VHAAGSSEVSRVALPATFDNRWFRTARSLVERDDLAAAHPVEKDVNLGFRDEPAGAAHPTQTADASDRSATDAGGNALGGQPCTAPNSDGVR
jgi:hypothetical protein